MDDLEPLRSQPRPQHGMSASPVRRGASPPTPTSSKGTIKDGQVKRLSPVVALAGRDVPSQKPSPKNLRIASAVNKPLVPALERKMHMESAGLQTRKGSDAEKWDAIAENGSGGREGRQFTVSNVGNNGRIYLRPSIRPPQQRYPQPAFVFPLTPPGTAGLEILTKTKSQLEDASELGPDPRTPTRESPLSLDGLPSSEPQISARPPNRRRAVSDSTIRENSAVKDSDTGALKVVISKPGEDVRPRTMEDVDLAEPPVLDINIPSWRIGTPRFSLKGTPLIRGSSYATTEDPHSTNVSMLNHSHAGTTIPLPSMASRHPSALLSPRLGSLYSARAPSGLYPPPMPDLPFIPQPLRSTYLSTHRIIEPGMFDDLTFKPACDDKCLVRYSPVTSAVTAASPPRLVAEITSPSFLDYELISDFFLTFRAFLETHDLLRMLVARLRWAMSRIDETGMVVRVRTFVALRHWILNYFMDDFVIDYGLRVTFCNLINDFVAELCQDSQSRKVELKILSELKKCWRRVCAHYWDGPAFEDSRGENAAISPGGIAGHRDPSLDPTFWEKDVLGPPRLEQLVTTQADSAESTSFYADVSRAGHVAGLLTGSGRPQTPENKNTHDAELGPSSPYSLASLDVVSCSFPGKSTRALNQLHTHPLAAHPVSSTSIYNQSGPIALTPKALVGKRGRPGHKRDNSLTDSLRDHNSDKVSFKDKEFLMSVPFAGSLVRGNLLPPGQAFVDVATPSDAPGTQRQTTVFRSVSDDMLRDKVPGGAMSAHGMKRLLASVRRALTNRNHGSYAAHTNLVDMSPIGPQGATTNRLPGTAIVPQDRPGQDGVRPPVRVDVLGAEVAEDFKRAVREEAALEADQINTQMMLLGRSEPAVPPELHYSVAHIDSTAFETMSYLRKARSPSSTGITTGSKSIVIVDATTPLGAEALASPERQSVETLTDTFMPHGADLTPPNTPPEQSHRGTPRRSSYLLNQHLAMSSVTQEPLSSYLPSRDTMGHRVGARIAGDITRASASTIRRYPPSTRDTYRMHTRNKSSRSQYSLNSSVYRRHASFSSGIMPHSTPRSFDATTYSEGSVIGHEHQQLPPPPLRVLRRRPGGDLRAATNVGELDPLAFSRSRSFESLPAFSESVRDSYDIQSQSNQSVNPDNGYEAEGQRQEVFSLGQLADKQAKAKLSLFSTHSSKPIMRPSFEAEAKKLAQIPDDDDDDGGIESALLKLEGRFTRKDSTQAQTSSESSRESQKTSDLERGVARQSIDSGTEKLEKLEHRHLHVNENSASEPDDEIQAPLAATLGINMDISGRPLTLAQSFLSEGSQESYSSIPLLERGLGDEVRSEKKQREWTNRSVLMASDDEVMSTHDTKNPDTVDLDLKDPSFTFIQKEDGVEIASTEPCKRQDAEEQSFLDDDSGNETDLSSELSTDEFHTAGVDHIIQQPPKSKSDGVTASPLVNEQRRSSMSPLGIFNHVARLSSPGKSLPDVKTRGGPASHSHNALTPEMTPTSSHSKEPKSPTAVTHIEGSPRKAQRDTGDSQKYSAHLPFILAFDSDVLAQQFTLIEKDALIEIDWKELIDMSWKNSTNGDSRSWVDFLRNSEAHGVEVVIARFNIMVKWAVSEIVLTQHIEERARCIIKYIHIARHCRRYRNFATLAQLTIALTSTEVERLTRTWALVPEHDVKTLRDLEMLVTPMRNFYNLRAEMETGSDAGCIPFVGIYTHDLLYNAQRPSEIASSPATAPLINFERCRIAAVVVKTLLRLLEASTKYTFQPIEGITERCLWIGALSDEAIRRHCETLV